MADHTPARLMLAPREPYAFPKRFIATTIIKYKRDHKSATKQYEIIMSYIDLWLPRARAYLPFGVAPTYNYKLCGRRTQTITVNSDVEPTYLCGLSHMLRDCISRMVIHQRETVFAPTPKVDRGRSTIPTPVCWCRTEPEACPIHTSYNTDCVLVTQHTVKHAQHYLVQDGHLVAYETPQTFSGIEFKYKLHNLRTSAFDLSYDGKYYVDSECKNCSYYTSFQDNAHFEYGRPHKIGRPALDGEYYLFGERINTGYDRICTYAKDRRDANKTKIEFRGKTYKGTRVDFPNGWARELDVSLRSTYLSIERAEMSSDRIYYKIRVTDCHHDTSDDYFFDVVVKLVDVPTFAIEERECDLADTRAGIMWRFYMWFGTRQVLAFFRPYLDDIIST